MNLKKIKNLKKKFVKVTLIENTRKLESILFNKTSLQIEYFNKILKKVI